MSKVTLACLGVLVFVSVASAQPVAPFPGGVQIDGGWVPCSHPLAVAAGRGCGATPVPTPTAPTPINCANVDPYVDPARALICGLQNVPPGLPAYLPTFRVGQRYFGGYTEFQMVGVEHRAQPGRRRDHHVPMDRG